MAIRGIFYVCKPKLTVRDLMIGEHAYVFISDFVLTTNDLLVPLNTEIFWNKKSLQGVSTSPYVLIQKTGDGYEETSYNLYLDVDEKFKYHKWYLQYEVHNKLAYVDRYIFFNNPPIQYIDQQSRYIASGRYLENVMTKVNNLEGCLREELYKILDIALAREKYSLAARVRDELQKRKDLFE